MAGIQVNYLSRDFQTVRADLINYVSTFFPNSFQDFNVNSPGMAILEMNAYSVDLLSYNIDKRFNSLFLDNTGNDRKSVYRLAKTKGYQVPGNRPGITIADITISNVPVLDDGPDPSYLPIYHAGIQIKGAGQIYQTIQDIDFSNDFSYTGQANRIITPIIDGNQNILYYQITKREQVQAGLTKVLQVEVVGNDAIPFYQLQLPDTNVLSVTNVIVFNQLNMSYSPTYADFNNPQIQYFEVDALPTQSIFMIDDSIAEQNGLQTGIYVEVPQRFEKEFMADGSCLLTFGGGSPNFSLYSNYLDTLTAIKCPPSNINVSQLLQNDALGVMIPPNSTIYVKYVVGGGVLSNVGSNVLQQVAAIDAVISGINPSIVQSIINSTTANNPIAAIGGIGLQSIPEILAYIGAAVAAQERDVTLDDYVVMCKQMPGNFGSPFRIQADAVDNKVVLYILSLDSNNNLTNISNSIIKNNLATYLTKSRMINDYVEIDDGLIINIQVEVDLFVNKNFNANEIKFNAAQTVASFFDVNNWQMGQTEYNGELEALLSGVPGGINVVDIRYYNMQGGPYSNTLLSQATGPRTFDPNTGIYRTQVSLLDNAIYVPQLAMMSILNISGDILVRTA